MTLTQQPEHPMQPFRHPSEPEPQFIPLTEGAVRLRMSRTRVLSLMTSGEIAGRRSWRGWWELRASDVERLVKQRDAATMPRSHP